MDIRDALRVDKDESGQRVNFLYSSIFPHINVQIIFKSIWVVFSLFPSVDINVVYGDTYVLKRSCCDLEILNKSDSSMVSVFEMNQMTKHVDATLSFAAVLERLWNIQARDCNDLS